MATPRRGRPKLPAKQLFNVKISIEKDLHDKLRRTAFYNDESYTDILKRGIEKEFAAALKAWQRCASATSWDSLAEE
jgi:hypothetical protein